MITFQAQKITKGQKLVSYNIICFKGLRSYKTFLLTWKWKA